MEAVRLQLANKTLLNPAVRQWDRAPVIHLSLRGTEARAQPSAYVRTTWAGKQTGAVRSLAVRAANNRQNLFFRLEWADPSHNPDYGDGSVFPDAAAVLLPVKGQPPLSTMGAPGSEILGWYWRANHKDAGEALSWTGFATEVPHPEQPVVTSATWSEGRWSVVIGAPLPPKAVNAVSFAVWEGSNQERAGLHAYAPEWQELTIE
jgi:complex iron-sulfur molybdoenzyme family reductase subunit gamma